MNLRSNFEYHPVVYKIISLLKENSFWFKTFEHEAVRTSEQAAKIRTSYSFNQGAKAIVIKAKIKPESKFVMLVFPANKKFDSKKVKQILKTGEIRFATEDEVKTITKGVVPGGVPPFGNLFNLQVYYDQAIEGNEKIVFNAGDQRFSIAMKSSDYLKIVKPNLCSLL